MKLIFHPCPTFTFGGSPEVQLLRDGSFENKRMDWNQKLHFYAGLFLIFFMWLFAFSRLLQLLPGHAKTREIFSQTIRIIRLFPLQARYLKELASGLGLRL